ncbi:MAG TPA: rod shape-determining protein RodA [Oceanospirillales bacterium]|nr:rod shape-determining protein RodA [Oceanospirillales bacterium]
MIFSNHTHHNKRHYIDWWLLFFIVLLMAYGLVILYSAGGWILVKKQMVRLALGMFVMIALAQIKPEKLAGITPWLYIMTIILLVAVFFFGVESKGAQRWLKIGIRFQPSELAKLTIPLVLAWFYRYRILPPNFKSIMISLLILMIPVLLIFKQPDLGTAILVAVSGLFVLFLAGLSWKYIAGGVVAVAAAAPVMWLFFMQEYQKKRVLTFLNPENDTLGSGWNIIQSKIAIGSGGLFGKGWHNGSQTQLDFLPEHSTDFILSVLSEEFGLLGVSLLLILYLAIIFRCLYISARSKDTFNRLFAGALTLTFFVYLFINAGMISGLLPVVGVPLPLVSYGGTSIITLMAAFGMIMSVYNHRKLLKS